jgi:hypothetical protein
MHAIYYLVKYECSHVKQPLPVCETVVTVVYKLRQSGFVGFGMNTECLAESQRPLRPNNGRSSIFPKYLLERLQGGLVELMQIHYVYRIIFSMHIEIDMYKNQQFLHMYSVMKHV